MRIRRAKTKAKKTIEPIRPPEPIQSPNNTLSLPSPPAIERSKSQPMIDLGVAQNEPPRSPGPSETSFESTPSSGGTPSAAESASQMSQSARTNGSSLQNRIAAVPVPVDPFKPVEITIMLSASGYLRGDTIHIHVAIDHTKHVKSLHGIIATLYRKARLNYYPELPMVDPDENNLSGRRIVRGLSISPGGSYHTYQKPLDQNFAAIIIDPLTLKTEVKTSLIIPEDAFPSISNVPGAMMTFKYYVEILCDVQGKLSPYDKKLPTPGISSLNGMRHGVHSNGAHMGYRGWSFIDTEELLREKTVLASAFEVVVGTRDSNRGGHWSTLNAHNETVLDDQDPETNHSNGHPSSNSANMGRQPSNRSQPSRPTTSCNNSNGEGPSNSQLRSQHTPDSPPPQFDGAAPDYQSLDTPTPSAGATPIPTFPNESTLTEKDRIRLAEQRLLPSAPPVDPDTEAVAAYTPSAPAPEALEPFNPLNSHHHQHPMFTAVLPMCNSSSAATPTASPPHLFAPPYESSATQMPDDKQELERRRLEALRSEPPSMDHANESEAHSSSGTERTEIPSATGLNGPSVNVPSAPVSNDHEEYTPTAPIFSEDEAMFGFRSNVGEALPKYER
jgi:arrestin-related trafficking adapter 9